MKTLLLAFLSVITTGLVSAHAQDDGSLPFPVSVGGQAATYKKGEPFAKLAKPVKNDAAIEITDKPDQMIIINVNKTDEKGAPAAGGQPAIIILQNTNKGTLAGTMDKQKLAAGNYMLSVIASGKTASILFKVE
ncbi:MAG: hypothetical protein ABIP20_04570 [Chthoniobacteraceae bacterium]